MKEEERPSTASPQKKKKKKAYKPNNAELREIKELLTYRMKAQRYPYSELHNDITNAQEKGFSHKDLLYMLKN